DSGGTPMSPAQPHVSQNTSVTVLVSSTANDQVTRFTVELRTLTLTSRSGKTVALLASPQSSEFMHLNGGIEPLTTVDVPDDVYTSAKVTLGSTMNLNEAEFVCIGKKPDGGLVVADDSGVTQAPAVNLPSPITVTGTSMALLLNLEVFNSAAFPSCLSSLNNSLDPFQDFSLTPAFTLAPIASPTMPPSTESAKVSGLTAIVASVGTAASPFTLTVAGGPFGTRTLSASSNSATVFQGVTGPSALSPGMFVNVDGAVQSDGSLVATRIEAEDPSAINDFIGPVIGVGSESLGGGSRVPVLYLFGRTELGPLMTLNPGGPSGIYEDLVLFDASNVVYKISGQFTNLESLPFVPSFNASNVTPGQNVDVTTLDYVNCAGCPHANTVTLVPQTIDGRIVGAQQAGNFVDWKVALASDDSFAVLAAEGPAPSNDPGHVEVYIDNNTQMLNTGSLLTGGPFRFYGLVFNDNGTLRMDCARVNDGVPLSAPSSSAQQVEPRAEIARHVVPGLAEKVTTVK
ncbi:MAG: hypothetical protein J2P13_08100, partial [Acidobacteria bacterium]|nr:hypothetical protein [Acidobacteriota bacterium]